MAARSCMQPCRTGLASPASNDTPLIRPPATFSPQAGRRATNFDARASCPSPRLRGEGGPERAKRVEGPGEGRVMYATSSACNTVPGLKMTAPLDALIELWTHGGIRGPQETKRRSPGGHRGRSCSGGGRKIFTCS